MVKRQKLVLTSLVQLLDSSSSEQVLQRDLQHLGPPRPGQTPFWDGKTGSAEHSIKFGGHYGGKVLFLFNGHVRYLNFCCRATLSELRFTKLYNHNHRKNASQRDKEQCWISAVEPSHPIHLPTKTFAHKIFNSTLNIVKPCFCILNFTFEMLPFKFC